MRRRATGQVVLLETMAERVVSDLFAKVPTAGDVVSREPDWATMAG